MDTLAGSESIKLRVQAAAVLARSRDARATQALGRAAISDPNAGVRLLALKLLARNPGGTPASAAQARLAAERATRDGDAKVRKQAGLTVSALTQNAAPPGAARGRTLVAVGQMADRTGRASRPLRDRMRLELQALLAGDARVQVNDTRTAAHFVIDGTIARLDHREAGGDVESTCAVQLVVSRPPRGIVTVVSGEAAVQKPRRQFRPDHRPRMEEEAMTHALKSAHESLSSFLARQ